ncbi:hypothetical protein BDW59DRAFT_165684 [Aspergillus cavernicola]|uniref:SGNH hydrolase-type esterase domain-containing protein n=1 Tax=Aspergillus cavernicola TaxID=176166 RepID=A0ABR4HTG3_9EURO
MQLWLKACTFAFMAQQALTYPMDPPLYMNVTDSWTGLNLHKRENLEGHSLRILPLGASITNGIGSGDQNGYRKHLRDALRWANAEVDMVGSLWTGTKFNNNDNKGHSGFTIQKGSGADDGPYKHKGVLQDSLSVFALIDKEYVADTIFWADLNGDGVDEMIWYNDPVDKKGIYRDFWDWESVDYLEFNVNDQCNARGVRWGDVDGDGFDDFICIGLDGNMYVSRNIGPPTNPRFENLGLYHANPRPGSSQTHVRLGDIDGDGRLDYCLIADNGDITCWRNGGIQAKAEYWQALGVVFTGKNKGNIDGVQLVDINGDHRADWLYVNDDGSVDIYINNQGHDKSLWPDWSNTGRTHAGMNQEETRPHVKFAWVSGSDRADYVWEEVKTSSRNKNWRDLTIHWWKNEGSGGTMLKAVSMMAQLMMAVVLIEEQDGNNYCDMTGDGVDDYVWVSDRGDIQIFRNINDPPNWGQHGWFYIKDWDRQYIRIADIDGDGKCNIIYHADHGAVVDWYKNNYSVTGFKFTSMGARNYLGPCEGGQRNGVGLFDLAVRFADLNGDKKADRLCIDPDGRTFAMMSTDSDIYTNMRQVKKPEGKDRVNLRFVDVNGDGKADMIWLDKFGGTAQVWYSEELEPAPDTQSSMKWRPGGDAYLQSARGEAIHFANLRGTRRADMIDANPRTNEATTWFSVSCGGGGGGDDGLIRDPGLPTIPEQDKPPSEEELPPGEDNPPPVGGFPAFDRFIAMGDSYSAGVGAGNLILDDYDLTGKCYKNEGAYSYQIWKSYPELQNTEFDFISCTGAKIPDMVVQPQFPDRGITQLAIINAVPKHEYGWATLSLGGNDVGFSKIAIWCLYFPVDIWCPGSKSAAWSRLEEREGQMSPLRAQLAGVYRDILNSAETPDFTLIVTGYAQFFNSETTACNLYSLSRTNFTRLTRSIRTEMNSLVVTTNNLIRTTVAQVNAEFAGRGKYIYFYDIDPQFEGRRFCEPTGHWRKDAWFYSPFRNPEDGEAALARVQNLALVDPDDDIYWDDIYPIDYTGCPPAGTELDTDLGAECELLRQLDPGPDHNPGLPPGDVPSLRPYIKKLMHPKFSAHLATIDGIHSGWQQGWGRPPPSGS